MFLADDAPDLTTAAQSDQLAGFIEAAFPTLRLGKRRLDQSGGDHVLLIVDEHFAFRFPRSGMHGLNLEIAVLERLRRRSPLQIPAYEYVDPAGRFAGYPFIKGTALTPVRFAALAGHFRNNVLQTAAMFLTELHGLVAGVIAPETDWPSAGAAADYAERGMTIYLPGIVAELPAQASLVERFYITYREIAPPQRVVIHGDLVVEHVLLDEQTEQLSGIIDFGDVALGDPAQDFLGFWAYGADAASKVVELYQPAGADSTFLSRSRQHFIRYRLDRIFEGMSRHDCPMNEVAAGIDALLAV